ncbi:MAG: HIT family protein [Planctomycetota bacterium]
MTDPCPLCAKSPDSVLWRDDALRIIVPEDSGWSGLCRVVWNEHVAEMTDLDEIARGKLMAAVYATERALRVVLAPDKINLASLGNLVPHLHWHVVPRWRDDSHFPAPIWAGAVRGARALRLDVDLDARLRRELTATLGTPSLG